MFPDVIDLPFSVIGFPFANVLPLGDVADRKQPFVCRGIKANSKAMFKVRHRNSSGPYIDLPALAGQVVAQVLGELRQIISVSYRGHFMVDRLGFLKPANRHIEKGTAAIDALEGVEVHASGCEGIFQLA